jgi:hypothetical protein
MKSRIFEATSAGPGIADEAAADSNYESMKIEALFYHIPRSLVVSSSSFTTLWSSLPL